MKPILSLYLKVFLVASFSYGLLILLLEDKVLDSFKHFYFLYASLLFGAMLSFTLVTVHLYAIRSIGSTKITVENIAVSHNKSITSTLNKKDFIQAIKKNSTLNKMDLIEIETGLILRTGISLRSWGEKIKITINALANEFEYTIVSSPKLKTTLVDFGKNLQNIIQVEELIKKHESKI